MKTTPLLLALALLIGACGGGEDSDNTAEGGAELTSNPAESTADEPTEGDSANGDNGDTGDGTSTETDSTEGADDDQSAAGTEGGGTVADVGDETLVAQTLGFNDLEVTAEVVGCIEEQGADPTVTEASSDEDAVATALAIFACLPKEFAEIAAPNLTAPTGTDADTVECVLETTYRYLGGLPLDQGTEALASTKFPPAARADLTPLLTDGCDVTAEQGGAILDQLN